MEEWYNAWRKSLEDYERRRKEEENRWRTWYETWQKFLEDYYSRWDVAEKRFARIEESLGASVEAQFSRYVWEDLREAERARRGYRKA